MSGTPRHDVIDLERDADAEQQGKCDDICEIERKTVQHANLEGNDAGEQERDQRQEYIRQSSQRDQKQNGDGCEGQDGGFDKGRGDGSSGFIEADRAPCRRWLSAKHRGREIAQHVGVVRVAIWQSLDAGRTVGGYPIADQVRRQRLDRHQLRGKALAKQLEIVNQRWHDRGFKAGPGAGICACDTPQQNGNIPRGFGGGAGGIARSRGKGLGCSLNRGYVFLIARGRAGPRWIEGGSKALRRGRQGSDLLVLIGWNEAVQRQSLRYLGKCTQASDRFIGLFERWRQYLRGVAAGFRIFLQFAVGHDRGRVRTLQIDRIEVKRQMQKQRCTGQDDEKRA